MKHILVVDVHITHFELRHFNICLIYVIYTSNLQGKRDYTENLKPK